MKRWWLNKTGVKLFLFAPAAALFLSDFRKVIYGRTPMCRSRALLGMTVAATELLIGAVSRLSMNQEPLGQCCCDRELIALAATWVRSTRSEWQGAPVEQRRLRHCLSYLWVCLPRGLLVGAGVPMSAITDSRCTIWGRCLGGVDRFALPGFGLVLRCR